MESFTRFIDLLRANSHKVISRGTGQAVAQCPAHDDNKPSLAIAHKDGKTLIQCFAGCSVEDVCASLELTPRDLFDQALEISTVVDLSRYRFNPEQPAATDPTPVTDPNERLEWVYLDADGNPYMRITKTRLADGSKTFRQSHWNGQQWINGLNNLEPVLYQLPQVLTAAAQGQYIAICEGEKDADTFNALANGIIATTAPMGAGKWRDTYTDALQGAAGIYIIHDNDEPGIKHAIKISQHLEQAQISHSILTPAVGKDFTDHINAGLDISHLINAADQIQQQKDAATAKALQRAIDEERIKQTARDTVRKELSEANASNRYALPIYTRDLAEELQQPDEETQYIIDQLWPNGANISLTATFKAGKTSTINNVIRALVDHQPLFNEFATNHHGRIAYLNYEVSPNQMRRWIRDVNIHNLTDVQIIHMRGHTWPLTSDYVIKHTIELLASNNITTLILDPLARAFVGSGDENSNADVGIFLDTLDYIKDQAGVANLLIAAHTGRNAEQGNNRARGASRFDDWVDARWMLSKDPDGQRWFQADGRDVSIDESKLDWDEHTRQQIIHIGEGKKEISQGTIDDQIIAIFKQYPRGINSQKELAKLCKETYGQAFGLSKSLDESALGRLIRQERVLQDGKRFYLIEDDPQGTFKQPSADSRSIAD